MSNKNILFCFAGPTASGKSTISKALAAEDSTLKLSISTTTRQPRAGEQDGREYFFVTPEEFEQRIKAGLFLEHAEFSGNRYGTEKRNIELAFADGRDLLLDIDVQGVQQLKTLYPAQTVTVFVTPPSMAELLARLSKRGSETADQTRLRLETAQKEIALLGSQGFSDYLIVNDALADALVAARNIVNAERLRFSRKNFQLA